MSAENLDQAWKVTQRPPSITRSFQFESYDKLREFLDELADLSERENFYPSLNFTRTQVNVNIQSDTDELGEREFNFAEKTDELLSKRTA